MIRFNTTIQQFRERGEKSGWSYVQIPAALAQQLKPGNKKSFRVKGKLDDHSISGIALLPMGDGDFIMALKADIRKKLRKQKGDSLAVQLDVDTTKIEPPKDLLDCLYDEPQALEYFKSLSTSHKNYFGNWINSAKTTPTRANRIARVVDAMVKKQDYATMLRAARDNKKQSMG